MTMETLIVGHAMTQAIATVADLTPQPQVWTELAPGLYQHSGSEPALHRMTTIDIVGVGGVTGDNLQFLLVP